MKKQKLKHLLKIGIVIFGISLLLWNCQKEDDNHIISSDQNKNKSISQTSLNDILNQNSLSKETFGLRSKNQKTSSKNKTNEPTFKLTSSKGLKYVDNGNAYHVFLMKRTDKIDSYYYNLVVHDHNGTLEKYIYKYPLDKSEGVTISKITNDNNINKNSKSTYSKPPVRTPIRTDLGDGCTETYVYDITPCPCVGHLDPAICFCQIQPVWKYVGGPYYYCPAPVTNNPTIEEPDDNDNNDPDLVRGTTVYYPIPPDAPTPQDDEPPTPLPTLEPDFDLDNGNSILIDQLDLTNLQKDWLDKLENINFKSDIENYLMQFVFTNQFNDAKSFAQQAVIAWMLNRNTVVDFEEGIIVNINSECQKEVLIEGLDNCSPLSSLVIDIFGGGYDIDYIIESSNLGPNTSASTSNIVKYNTITKKCFIKTTVDKNYLDTATDLSIARTIIHESFHATLTFMVVEGKFIYNGSPDSSFANVMNGYINYLETNNNDQYEGAQHEILLELVSEMASALKNYGVQNGYSLPSDFYSDLSWGGLTHLKDPNGAIIINPLFVNAVPNANDRTRIIKTIAAEVTNSTQGSLTPKGKSCD